MSREVASEFVTKRIKEVEKRLEKDAEFLKSKNAVWDVSAENSDPWTNPDIDIPGGPPRGPSKHDIPTGDEGYEKEPIDTRMSLRVNREKIRILNQALALGCSWAKDELMKLKVLKTHDHKESWKLPD